MSLQPGMSFPLCLFFKAYLLQAVVEGPCSWGWCGIDSILSFSGSGDVLACRNLRTSLRPLGQSFPSRAQCQMLLCASGELGPATSILKSRVFPHHWATATLRPTVRPPHSTCLLTAKGKAPRTQPPSAVNGVRPDWWLKMSNMLLGVGVEDSPPRPWVPSCVLPISMCLQTSLVPGSWPSYTPLL